MKKIIKPKIVIPLGVLLIFAYVFISNRAGDQDLRKNGIVVNATIVEFLGSSQGGSGANPGYLCRFNFDREEKELISRSSIKTDARKYVGKTFPALYSAKHNKLRLLMTRGDYNKFNITYPDSLKRTNVYKNITNEQRKMVLMRMQVHFKTIIPEMSLAIILATAASILLNFLINRYEDPLENNSSFGNTTYIYWGSSWEIRRQQ